MPTIITIYDDIIEGVEGNTDTVEIISIETQSPDPDGMHTCERSEEDHYHQFHKPTVQSEYKYQLRELVDSIAPYGDTGTAYFSAEILEASIRMLEEKPTPKYVHQFLTPTGWDTSTNDDGTPSTFDTEAEAEAELEIFHNEVAAAVSRGDMDDHNRADWRVAELEG